jgi:ParB-like chromosome segregation protein Spo0J
VTASHPSQAGGDGEVSEAGSGAKASGPPSRIWSESDLRAPHPEALAAPAIVWVRHEEIDGDPFNIRERLPSIQRLCWSIYQWGLLENLIVVEHPRAAASGKRFELRAGSRRFEAIRRLIEGGVEPPQSSPDREKGLLWSWPPDRPIPVLVLGSEGHYEHMVENIERSPPEPWEIGRRVNEILSAGVSSRELGTRLGRSNGWVNRYAHVGRGLAPELIELLRKEHAELKLGDLSHLASIRDRFGDPDGELQIEAYHARKGRRRQRPRRIDPHSFRATIKRLQYLRSDMPIPALLRPVVVAIIAYLEGGERPGFKKLETNLFDQIRDFSPHAPEDV